MLYNFCVLGKKPRKTHSTELNFGKGIKQKTPLNDSNYLGTQHFGKDWVNQYARGKHNNQYQFSTPCKVGEKNCIYMQEENIKMKTSFLLYAKIEERNLHINHEAKGLL